MSNYSRRDFMKLIGAVAASAAVLPSMLLAQDKKVNRPNIVYIMSDDHAAHAISAYGSKVNQTPNIDRLAKNGIRFDHCYAVNSICTPSRATIITGKYSHINGVTVFNRFDGAQPTVAKYLQAAGYYTGIFGKWHLESAPQGFDKWTILPGQGVYHDPAFLEAGGKRTIKGYVTDIITDLSIEFLKNRPGDKPFFLMCHNKAPHRPWEPDAKHAKMYEDKAIPEPATLRDEYATRTDAAHETTMTIARHLNRVDLKVDPPAGLEGDALLKWKYQRYMQDYLRCVASVDDNVGRLLDFLDKDGLSDNTIVIYTSDQGFFLGDHGWFDKRFMYEESIKMPFILRWPGVAKAGSVQDALAINADFAPTFMDVAGLPVPVDMQGRSLAQLLGGERPAKWRKSFYYRYYHDPGDHNTRAHYGVRTETHKLIYFWKKDQWEMYDLVNDPAEMKNIYNDLSQKERVEELQTELYRLKNELNDHDQFADSPGTGSGKAAKALKP
ncbi:MAG: sulfatase/phosphatase domain-containing protein [bacterium]